MIAYLSKLLFLTKGHHKSLLTITCLFLFISLLEVFGTGIIGPFIAVATMPRLIRSNYWLNFTYKALNFSSEQGFLIGLGLLVLFAFFIKAFLSFQSQKMVFSFGYGLKGEISHRIFNAYLAAPYSFHLRNNSATLIQNIAGTTDNVSLGVVMPLLTAISNLTVTTALFLLLLITSPLALILIAFLLPVVFLLIKLLRSRLDRWSRHGWEASAEMIRTLNHGLGGLKETRVIGCEDYFGERMETQSKIYAKNISLSQAFSNLPRFVIEAFMITFLVSFTLLFINFSPDKNQNLTSVLGIFALASIRLLPAISNMVGNFNTCRANSFAVNKLYADFKAIENSQIIPKNLPPKTLTSGVPGSIIAQPVRNPTFTKQIDLEQVTFHYPNAVRNSLDRIQLRIHKGQSIGLIGRSGAGKTTLVDVLLGLFTPQAGDIKVDGVSIYNNLRAWQNMLGYVPQSIFLTDDTLERNIAFGVPDHLIDPKRLRKALNLAQLTEVVNQLPEGVKTIVGERGVLLSGGQRQRVGIARVLYHEREILVFDEATAALDSETEQLITEATKSLSGKKTIIIIAHRLSTIEHCDCIYQLDQGKILKSGSYRDVVLSES